MKLPEAENLQQNYFFTTSRSQVPFLVSSVHVRINSWELWKVQREAEPKVSRFSQ